MSLLSSRPFRFSVAFPGPEARSVLLLCAALLLPSAHRAGAPQVFGGRGEPFHRSPSTWVAEGGGLLLWGEGTEVRVGRAEAGGVPLSILTLDSPGTGGVVAGPFAYVAEAGGGLRVFDLRDPEFPSDAGRLALPGEPGPLGLAGDLMLVAVRGEGVLLLRLAANHHCHVEHGSTCCEDLDPLDVAYEGLVSSGADISGLAAGSDAVAVATRDGRLLAFELAPPHRRLGAVRLPSPARALAQAGGGFYALFQDRDGGLYRWTDRGAVERAAGIRARGRGLAAAGRTLYVAGESGLFRMENAPLLEATVSVTVGNFFFSPSVVSLNPGDQVRWTWAGGSHSTTSGTCPGGICSRDGIWDSGVKTSGTFSRTFTEPGSFPYYCTLHGDSMTGRVDVSGAPGLSASSSASPVSGPAPLEVFFTGTATGGAAPYGYLWDFGDGASSTDANPNHTYAADGTYTVALSVTDSASATADASPLTIQVGPEAVEPPVIASVVKRGNPFRLIVSGSRFSDDMDVFINGSEWSNTRWKSEARFVLKGGGSLKAAVPKNIPVSLRFVNPDGGEATVTFQWP
ncbi:MAG: PKD domain-containing protein [Acidobacteriota bacterium]